MVMWRQKRREEEAVNGDLPPMGRRRDLSRVSTMLQDVIYAGIRIRNELWTYCLKKVAISINHASNSVFTGVKCNVKVCKSLWFGL